MLIYGVDNDYLNLLLGRGDFILSDTGQLKCIEFNVQSNMGGWELDLIEPVYVNIPVISKFLEENNLQYRHNRFFPLLLQHVLQSFLEKFPGLEKPGINIAIAFPELVGIVENSNSIHLQNVYKTILQQESAGLTGNLVTCGFDVLKIRDHCLVCNDEKIDISKDISDERCTI